jgi:hypothetical protein
MTNDFTLEGLIDALAKRVAAQVRAELADNSMVSLKPRLLTVAQAANYMGRTEEAMQHMVVNGKVPGVRVDRRVFIDVRDDRLILDAKTNTGR